MWSSYSLNLSLVCFVTSTLVLKTAFCLLTVPKSGLYLLMHYYSCCVFIWAVFIQPADPCRADGMEEMVGQGRTNCFRTTPTVTCGLCSDLKVEQTVPKACFQLCAYIELKYFKDESLYFIYTAGAISTYIHP